MAEGAPQHVTETSILERREAWWAATGDKVNILWCVAFHVLNSIAFANVDDVERDFPRIRVMGTIGWIASGLACGFLPQMMGYADISDSNIPLLMTAASSALLGVFAFFLPNTPPKITRAATSIRIMRLRVEGGRLVVGFDMGAFASCRKLY